MSHSIVLYFNSLISTVIAGKSWSIQVLNHRPEIHTHIGLADNRDKKEMIVHM